MSASSAQATKRKTLKKDTFTFAGHLANFLLADIDMVWVCLVRTYIQNMPSLATYKGMSIQGTIADQCSLRTNPITFARPETILCTMIHVNNDITSCQFSASNFFSTYNIQLCKCAKPLHIHKNNLALVQNVMLPSVTWSETIHFEETVQLTCSWLLRLHREPQLLLACCSIIRT